MAIRNMEKITFDGDQIKFPASAILQEDLDGDITELKEDLTLVNGILDIQTTDAITSIVTLTDGYYAADGTFHESTSYGYTSNIAVQEGDVVTVRYDNGSSIRFVAAYNDNTVVSDAGSNTGLQSYTVPSGVNNVILSIVLNSATPYYVTVTRGIEPKSNRLDDIELGYMRTDNYLDYSMVNRLNPQEAQVGKFLNAAGTIVDKSDYLITGYIPINSGETLYCYCPPYRAGHDMRTFTAYDKDKNVLPNLGSNSVVSSISQTGDMAFIRCSLYYTGENTGRTQYTYCICTKEPPIPYVPRYGNTPVFFSKYEREKIYVNATDTESQVIQKFVYAFGKGDCDVIFDRATYNFGEELATVQEDYHLTENEIPIGNNCRYYFNGSTLNAVLDLDNLPDSGDLEYYCNLFGCGRNPSSFEIYDGILNATDTRYIVHDEASAKDGSYRHLYKNIEMNYTTDKRQETIRKCIGGGTGASGVVEIVGCKFTTDGTDECVSWHGNSTDVNGAKFNLNVRNSWFSNRLRFSGLSANQSGKLFYCGNSSASVPIVGDGVTSTVFLNEVRS